MFQFMTQKPEKLRPPMLNEHKKKALIDLLLHDASPQEIKDLSSDLEDLADEMCKEKNLHQFTDDQCGKPEHRFCMVCYEPQYPKADRSHAREGKANEPVASKATLPGESPGSRSIFGRFYAWVSGWNLG